MELRERFRIKKVFFILFLALINGGLIFLLTYFDDSWVQYLVISVVLVQLAYLTIEILLIIIFYIVKKIRRLGKERPPIKL